MEPTKTNEDVLNRDICGVSKGLNGEADALLIPETPRCWSLGTLGVSTLKIYEKLGRYIYIYIYHMYPIVCFCIYSYICIWTRSTLSAVHVKPVYCSHERMWSCIAWTSHTQGLSAKVLLLKENHPGAGQLGLGGGWKTQKLMESDLKKGGNMSRDQRMQIYAMW